MGQCAGESGPRRCHVSAYVTAPSTSGAATPDGGHSHRLRHGDRYDYSWLGPSIRRPGECRNAAPSSAVAAFNNPADPHGASRSPASRFRPRGCGCVHALFSRASHKWDNFRFPGSRNGAKVTRRGSLRVGLTRSDASGFTRGKPKRGLCATSPEDWTAVRGPYLIRKKIN